MSSYKTRYFQLPKVREQTFLDTNRNSQILLNAPYQNSSDAVKKKGLLERPFVFKKTHQ